MGVVGRAEGQRVVKWERPGERLPPGLRVPDAGAGRAAEQGQGDQRTTFSFAPTAVPKPGSVSLTLLGGIALGGFAWRRRRAAVFS